MAATKESNMSTLYVELNRFGQNGEYERALKTANKSKVTYVLVYRIIVQLIVWKMAVKYVPYVHIGPCMTLLRVHICSAL